MLRNSQNQLFMRSLLQFTRRLASTKKPVSKVVNKKLKKLENSELPAEESINSNFLTRMLGQYYE